MRDRLVQSPKPREVPIVNSSQDSRYTLRTANGRIELETRRLLIRGLQENDIPALIEYLSADDPMVKRVMGIEPTRDAIAAYWGAMSERDPLRNPEWLSLLVEFRPERKVVGNVDYGVTVIDATHKLGSIGWSLAPVYRGHGIATEAARALLWFLFGHLGVHRVHARTGSANASSWRLMERLGMRREAHFRESHTNLAGQWDDEFVYAILKTEWDSLQSTASSS